VNTHVISYDLHRPGQNYDDLIEYLKSLPNWWHCLESFWIVKSEQSASNLRDNIKRFVDPNDEVLVMKVTTHAWASFGLSDRCNDWLRDNL
jgi:hypothetical protein